MFYYKYNVYYEKRFSFVRSRWRFMCLGGDSESTFKTDTFIVDQVQFRGMIKKKLTWPDFDIYDELTLFVRGSVLNYKTRFSESPTRICYYN